MGNALGAVGEIGARPGGARVGGIEDEIAAHAGGEVDDDIDARIADMRDRLAVERRVARGLAGLGVAHMEMDDRRALARRLERRIGDLTRRYGNRGMLADRVAGAGDRAGNDDFGVQIPLPSSSLRERRALVDVSPAQW